MMTASSSAFMVSIFTQTGSFIQDLIPLLLFGVGLLISLIAFKIIYRAFYGVFKTLFK